jgi:hypothetical protein
MILIDSGDENLRATGFSPVGCTELTNLQLSIMILPDPQSDRSTTAVSDDPSFGTLQAKTWRCLNPTVLGMRRATRNNISKCESKSRDGRTMILPVIRFPHADESPYQFESDYLLFAVHAILGSLANLENHSRAQEQILPYDPSWLFGIERSSSSMWSVSHVLLSRIFNAASE